MGHILAVDDEKTFCELLARLLRADGHSVDTATSGEQAIALLRQQPYDMALLDIHMEPVSGVEVMAQVREIDPDMVIIILTASGSLESAVEAVRARAFDYIFKSEVPDVIVQRVRDGLGWRDHQACRQAEVDFCDWLNQQIANRGWSMAEFGRRIGYSRNVVSRVLNRRQSATQSFRTRTAQVLGTPPIFS